MQIIREINQIKSLDQNIGYACMGVTRSNALNQPYDLVASYTIGNAEKTFCILWDNEYYLKRYMNEQATPTIFDEPAAISWCEQKGFDYLYIPTDSLIDDLLSGQKFQDALEFSNNAIVNEGYKTLLGVDYNPGNLSWIRLLLARHYYFFSNQNQDRALNRTYQATGPDGTWGFIFKHFCTKYCGGEYPIIPLIRNANGLAFDLPMEKFYSIDLINIFISMLPSFNAFSTHRNVDKLKLDLTEDLTKSAIKETQQNYFFYSLDYFCDEIITQNKYILKLQVRGRHPKTYNTAGYDLYRLWEYDPTL